MGALGLGLAAAAMMVVPSDGKMEELASVPIEGARTDCTDFLHSVQLAEDVSMKYLIVAPDDGAATLSVSMEFGVEAWVSLGFSPDDKGKMVGSEAIVGLPLEPVGKSNPGKYHMTSEKVDGVFLRDDAEQTLTDGNVWQENGRTYLTFTKKLVEPGEVPIYASEPNYFLWAYGYENELGLHDKKTGAGSFILDMALACVPEGDVVGPLAPPSRPSSPEEEVSAPTEEAEAPPTEAEAEAEALPNVPVSPPVAAPVEAPAETETSDAEIENEASEDVVDAEDVVDLAPSETAGGGCSGYQGKVILDDKLSMSYVVRGDEGGGDISVKLEYDGEAWVSLAVAPDAGGKMVGSEAVIALPDEPVGPANPGEYHMTTATNAGVFLMDDERQTLSDGTVVQEGGRTVVTFTKRLSEEGKVPILGSGTNTFLWAYGYTNDLNLHRARGSFVLGLSPCDTNAAAEQQGGAPTEVSAQNLSRYTADQTRTMWFAHAILGLLAWAVLSPLAISSSWLRSLLQRWGGLWFKVHMYLNVLVLLLTVAAFGIAVALYGDERKEHFVGTHEAMGLTIFLIAMVQAGNGIFRPSAPKKSQGGGSSGDHASSLQNTTRTVGSNVVVSDKQGEPRTSGASIEAGIATLPPSEAGSQNEEGKEGGTVDGDASSRRALQCRVAWEALHRMLGYFLLFVGLWQVWSGIVLYSNRFGTKDYAPALWAYIGCFAALVMMLTVYLRVRELSN